MTGKQFYSKAETRARLQVGRVRYEYLIAAEILSKPVEIVPGTRPVHTDSQIRAAEAAIQRQLTNNFQPKNAPKMKPLSAKQLSAI